MPLQRGEVQGYDFNRSVVEFTMLNHGKVILCAISTTAMDDIEGKRNYALIGPACGRPFGTVLNIR